MRGVKFDLVVVDTLARVMGGLDENLAPDIADLQDAIDRFVKEHNDKP